MTLTWGNMTLQSADWPSPSTETKSPNYRQWSVNYNQHKEWHAWCFLSFNRWHVCNITVKNTRRHNICNYHHTVPLLYSIWNVYCKFSVMHIPALFQVNCVIWLIMSQRGWVTMRIFQSMFATTFHGFSTTIRYIFKESWSIILRLSTNVQSVRLP